MTDARVPRDVTQPRPAPNAKWICGHTRLGMACTTGPDDRGRCCQLRRDRASSVPPALCEANCSCQHQCELAKLPDAALLPLHAELGPCIPIRTSWYWRQTLALNLAILTGGILLLCMTLPQREAIFVPGNLSHKHAQILSNRLVSERCSLCHPNSHSLSTFASQDELCLKCHQQRLPDAVHRNPHDLNDQQLTKLIAKWSTPGASPSALAMAETQCATCHIEHHGESFDLTTLSDASCQACHQRQFPSLANGHPQFENYPYRIPRHIAFDHNSHQHKHFAAKQETFDCSRCHVDSEQTNSVGSVFRSVGFEKACASCHQEPIGAAVTSGWAVLQLPSLSTTDTRDASLGLNDWPTSAQFGYEGEISVPLRLLLAADPQLQQSLQLLPPSGKIEAIQADEPGRAAVARQLAQGIRRLVREVATEGQAAWQRRLLATAELMLQRPPTEREIELTQIMSRGLPPDLLRQIELNWFGQSSGLVQRAVPPVQLIAHRGAPNFLTGDSVTGDSLTGDSETLDDLVPDMKSESLLNEADADLLLVPDAASPLDETLLGEAAPLSAPARGQLTKLRGAAHVAAGGWYLDPELLALQYMPTGHADSTLSAWAEYMVIVDQQRAPEAAAWSEMMHGSAVPGGCTQCHLLDSRGVSPTVTSPWASLERPASLRPFTKFDHTPHLTLPKLSDCGYCHVLQRERPHTLHDLYQQARRTASGTVSAALGQQSICEYLSTEFIDMRVDQCAACHHAGGANASCSQCHNYHVGTSGLEWSNGPARPLQSPRLSEPSLPRPAGWLGEGQGSPPGQGL